MGKIELGLYFYGDSISIFSKNPPTIDDGINSSVQEKIRRFNNATAILAENINHIETFKVNGELLVDTCKDLNSPVDVLFRKLVRNVYMELFVYQEKLLNLACNIFFLEDTSNRQKNFKALKKRANYFSELSQFIEKCENIKKDKKFNFIMRIRDDEVHNMSQIDSFHYDFRKVGEGIQVVNKGYKIKTKTLRDGYLYAISKLIEIRNILQELISTDKLWEIYYTLERNNEEIWTNQGINKNEVKDND